jgi:hypothetical protein
LNFYKFYIFVGYSDGVRGYIFWDHSAQKIITSRDMYMEQSIIVQDQKGRFVCKFMESFHGLKVPRKLYNMLDYFMVILNLLRSDYNHFVYFERLENGTIIFLVLYVDDMIFAIQSMFKNRRLNVELANMFQMTYLGAPKQIFGMGVHIEWENMKLWLSQKNNMEKILMRFKMYIVKSLNIPIAFHCNLSSSLCPSSNEEKNYMSHVPYANTIGKLMIGMKCLRLDISHGVGVVSGHVENP